MITLTAPGGQEHCSRPGGDDMSTTQLPPEDRSGAVRQGRSKPPAPARRFDRRALLLGAAGTGAGITAGLVAGAAPAQAAQANGTPVELGESNTATGTTAISTNSGYGLWASSTGHAGVRGDTTLATSSGVSGHDDSGSASGTGTAGTSTNGTGVSGASTTGAGVLGRSTANAGVFGSSDTGFGVLAANGAFSISGDGALGVLGPAVFSRSGIATVTGTKKKPKSSVVVSALQGPLTPASMILATSQSSAAGVAYAVPDLKAKSFTIHLTKSVSTPVKIAWLIIENPA
jgi:hypothetical protein